MTTEQAFEVLKKHILDQLEDEVEEAEIVMEASMMELGANSLDIVEIVSNTMRELKAKVPRDQLAQLKTIGELAAKMAECAD
jgi:polyketide biosynthesis acyl carrier protein